MNVVTGTLHCAEIFRLIHAFAETHVLFFTLLSPRPHHHSRQTITLINQRLRLSPNLTVRPNQKPNQRLRPKVAGDLVQQHLVYLQLQP